MVRGAALHGRPQVTKESRVARAGERGEMQARGEGERMDGLRGKGSSGV